MAKKQKWRKCRPDSTQEIEDAVLEERNLTERWYKRIGGRIPWTHGEKQRLDSTMEAQAAKVNALLSTNAIRIFESLSFE
jgi:hypothetical protein